MLATPIGHEPEIIGTLCFPARYFTAAPPACLQSAIEPIEFAVSAISFGVVPPSGNLGLGSISGASRVSEMSVKMIALTLIAAKHVLKFPDIFRV